VNFQYYTLFDTDLSRRSRTQIKYRNRNSALFTIIAFMDFALYLSLHLRVHLKHKTNSINTSIANIARILFRYLGRSHFTLLCSLPWLFLSLLPLQVLHQRLLFVLLPWLRPWLSFLHVLDGFPYHYLFQTRQ